MMEQSKRSMELQVSKIQLHSRMLEKSRAELQVVLQFEKKKRQRLKEKLKMLKVRQNLATGHFSWWVRFWSF